MNIGYLHIGSPQHGVCRYGILLAKEAQKRPDLNIVEVDLILTSNWQQNRSLLVDAARQLSTVELVHIQYSLGNNKEIWGHNWLQLYHLWIFIRHCSSAIVVTIHDIYYLPSLRQKILKLLSTKLRSKDSSWSASNQQTRSLNQTSAQRKTKIKHFLIKIIRSIQNVYKSKVQILILKWLLNQVKLILVCSQEEAQRLNIIASNDKTRVVYHFVENRAMAIGKQEARAILGFKENQLIVTLLGFIHQRKGYDLLLEALSQLDQKIQVIFAGRPSPHPSAEKYLNHLLDLAKAKNLELRVTGYLSEQELELYLAATDLAVCPFKTLSASGSLSTWISVAKPILAYNLPQIEEYNQLEPGAIATFTTYSAEGLAKAIAKILNGDITETELAMTRLRQQLLLPVIFERHLNYYRDVVTDNLNQIERKQI